MAGLFSVARPAILAASRSARLRQVSEKVPVTRKVVSRFVPGERTSDAVGAVVDLRAGGCFATVDYLGEDTTDPAQATATVEAYLQLLEAFAGWFPAEESPKPMEVSLKLSALGQALPGDGEKIALDNARRICERAAEVGVWVTVDAEDHTTTDSTLGIVRQLRTEWDWVGTVLQAYLKRTHADCEEFAASGARIRLCKGAYDEPASVAYREPEQVTANYLDCLRTLMAGSGYPMIASHDPVIIAAVPGLAAQYNRGTDDFEYQMLYGIRESEQQRLVNVGSHVRVYIPYGTEWYGYFVRRLAERPANLTFFLRALAEKR
ncbi:proline dehydrogenase family protein [Mycolicibacterium brumae]|uniref:proline dehydrogenase n=1 Tax=Mycolicibacterium brumae TaxID=85968 RepID=A0A2G5PEH9_9MYCO|nr:proline dehydrogenase family protein [Mycolicibacterium brumae]MCV7192085.1 proline dehydrogenase family protein [Mycolicibacterium brumae]PIB76719.1 proline dehydrogenase [Mycolicibacterium brumae]RWA20750.1 hypothetical protein MBRU_03565 [Mycolicibacterium brumae DSM 44177]UWW07849.1 proline dehydrogenase family protein [Mycolicibacterium brumae]